MHEPEGSGRLAAYLARELDTDYRLIAPEMPDADDPRYQAWRDRIEQELEAIDGKVIFVGHSFGGSILLNYLAEGSYRKPVRGLFLVSVPNWGPGGWAYDEFAVPNDAESRLPASRIFLLDSELTRSSPSLTPSRRTRGRPSGLIRNYLRRSQGQVRLRPE
jgi:predicted alpha/beta hydrolase family esterase